MKRFSYLWLFLSALAPLWPADPPIARAQSATARDPDSAQRNAIAALARLGSGYFQRVVDPDEIREVAAMMEHDLGEIGINAQIGRCDWMGLVAVGTALGNRAYGAACRVRIGRAPERPLLICASLYSGTALHAPAAYTFDDGYIELFIRRACY